MTQQTNGTPALKYSEETFRDLYEALKELIERDDYGSIRLPTQARDIMVKALAKAGG